MKKIGLLFPGQGAQAVGMGKELYDNCAEAREVLDKANEILGFDIKKTMFEGPEDSLRQTQVTQPAVFAMSMAAYKVFTSKFKAEENNLYAAGHSLGEYSALAASGYFNLEDGLKLVKSRGEFIQKACESNPGTMAAIIGLDKSKIVEICESVKNGNICEAVNFNSAGQIVIAGSKDKVHEAVNAAEKSGATKAVMLNVSGPFHSSLMTPASEMMKQELTKYNFSKPKFPVITNCDAETISDENVIKEKLVRQINNPVLWEDSIKKMIAEGVEVFIEIGPGRVLSGLLRRIDKSKKAYNIEDMKSLDKTIQELSK